MNVPPNQPDRRRSNHKRLTHHSDDTTTHLLKSSVEAVLKYQGLESTSLLAKIAQIWPRIVGERMSSHALPSKIDGKELIVIVDHPAWATELRLMNSKIVKQLENELETPSINRLKVHVRPSNSLD